MKGGTVYGATDEFGEKAVENKVHVHDLHATILQLLGFDHTKLTYRYNGRDFRLTDNFGNVVKGVLCVTLRLARRARSRSARPCSLRAGRASARGRRGSCWVAAVLAQPQPQPPAAAPAQPPTQDQIEFFESRDPADPRRQLLQVSQRRERRAACRTRARLEGRLGKGRRLAVRPSSPGDPDKSLLDPGGPLTRAACRCRPDGKLSDAAGQRSRRVGEDGRARSADDAPGRRPPSRPRRTAAAARTTGRSSRCRSRRRRR